MAYPHRQASPQLQLSSILSALVSYPLVNAVSIPQSQADPATVTIASSISPPTVSSSPAPSATPHPSGPQISHSGLLAAILVSVLVVLVIGITLYVWCRARGRGYDFGYGKQIREITKSTGPDEKQRRAFYDLGRCVGSRDIEESHRLSVAQLSPALDSPRTSLLRFGGSHRGSGYAHVRSVSLESDGSCPGSVAGSSPRASACIALSPSMAGALQVQPASPKSDGRVSPWTIGSGRDTPERQHRRWSRSRNQTSVSTISLPLTNVEDERIGTVNSAPLAWSAERIASDGSGRITPSPFEIRGFSPIITTATSAEFGSRDERYGDATTLSPYYARNITARASIPLMLAPPSPAVVVPQQSHELGTIGETAMSDQRSLYADADEEERQSEGRSRAQTLESITTIRSSVDTEREVYFTKDEHPLPAHEGSRR